MKTSILLASISGIMASEMVSRIVVPLPKLMKYSEAGAACEAEGMRLVEFSSVTESLEYAAATLVEKNLGRVWIGAVGTDRRTQLALEVFDGLPITHKIEQVWEDGKMLAVLCEPIYEQIVEEKTAKSIELKELPTEHEVITDSSAKPMELELASEEIVICKFEVDSEDKSVQILNEGESTGNDIDLIKSKGKGRGCERRKKCSKSRKSSSSSSECDRPRHRHYRKRRGGYSRQRSYRKSCSSSSSTSSCRSRSSSSSSECDASDSCDPYERSRCSRSSSSCSSSSSSSSSEECGRNRRRGRRSNRRSSRRSYRKSRQSKSKSSSSSKSKSSSSSSSDEKCSTSRCGISRGQGKFFREFRLSQRIN